MANQSKSGSSKKDTPVKDTGSALIGNGGRLDPGNLHFPGILNFPGFRGPIAPGMFYIRKPSNNLDALTRTALQETAANEFYRHRYELIKGYIRSNGLTAKIAEVSKRLNKTGLDLPQRLLLSEESVYGFLLHYAINHDGVSESDVDGLYQSVLRNLEGIALPLTLNNTDSVTEDEDPEPPKAAIGPKYFFYQTLVDKVLESNSVSLSEPLISILYLQAFQNGVSLAPVRVVEEIMSLLDKVRAEGELPAYVMKFLSERNEVSPSGNLENLKQEMVKYLRRLQLNISSLDDFNAGNFDEYFALAYDHALKQSAGGDDPLSSVFGDGSTTDWNFEVDTFESIEEQGIERRNIMAAGALYYIYELGERLGFYKLADALILRWAGGALDIPQGATASKLYKFYKKREDRNTFEERAMVYKRALNLGDGELLSNMIVNRDFQPLWHKLMNEVVEFIRKSEDLSGGDEQVSRQPIYQATRELQYNLTTHMTGMAHLQVTESYAHLRDVFDILNDREIVEHFAGGFRKNMWTVIERLSREEFNTTPNISAIRNLAVEGNKIFQWVAEFDPGSVTDDTFRSFLASAESYIISQADESDMGTPSEEEDIFETVEEDDDFDDFDDF